MVVAALLCLMCKCSRLEILRKMLEVNIKLLLFGCPFELVVSTWVHIFIWYHLFYIYINLCEFCNVLLVNVIFFLPSLTAAGLDNKAEPFG